MFLLAAESSNSSGPSILGYGRLVPWDCGKAEGKMPNNILQVSPASVELQAGESQAFTAVDSSGSQAAGVEWSIVPEGGIDKVTGVYSAPFMIFRPRRLTVIARQIDQNQKETARARQFRRPLHCALTS
jgi:hypothetical protein